MTYSCSESLDVLKAANHELNLVKIIWRTLKNEKELMLYCLEHYYNKKKVGLHLIEDTVGISTLRAMIFHFNLQALDYFSSLCNGQQLVNHLV